jgi:hypothetical protein
MNPGALDRGDRRGDRLGVARVGGVAGQVDDQQVGVGLDDVDRHHVLGDTLGDHDGDTLGGDIRLVSPDMKAPVATSLAMGAGS